MGDYNIGDKAIFAEHAVLLRDLDSKMEEAVTVMVKETDIAIEDTACKFAKRSDRSAIVMSGNAMEAEYLGRTGRTLNCEYRVIKTGWVKVEELTPDDSTINIDDYFKFD